MKKYLLKQTGQSLLSAGYDFNGDFKELPRKPASDKVLCNKTFNMTQNSKCDVHQKSLTLMAYKYFDRKSTSMLANKSATRAKEFVTQA